MKTTNQSRIFISYSHRGNGPEWRAWLLRHLGVFERHHLLDMWHDGKIRICSYWDDDITQAMSSARLAVVLLTPEALESQYILEKEFPFLRERQQHDKLPVFPVICESCGWKVHDWLRATQAPNESNPISPLTEAEQNHIFRKLATDIATEISRVALAELPKSDQPPPSDHIYLEKFPLTRSPGLREEKLIGREQELALFDLAFAQPHTAIVSLVAWGGVGKTMLVQHWLQRLQREGWFGAQRVYAWSFYSQGTKEDRQASEDMFIAHAIEWFGVQCELTLSAWEKGRLLAEAVARERTLLILDGIEPLQYPPGPMGGQLRAPGVQSLLKHLARKANTGEQRGLCLITTREPLTDLADFQRREGSPWGSVLRVDLGNLTDEAGAALLHHAGANRAGAAGIKNDDKELLAASREVDGHALTLNLLGRFLARAHGGDIRRRDLVKFEEADREEQGGTTFRMLAAFENWFNRGSEIYRQQLAVLRILGLFDRPADAGCIAALRSPPSIAGLTDSLFTSQLNGGSSHSIVEPILEEDWNVATSSLAEFGLLTIEANDDSARSLDCHPLIREHFAKHLIETSVNSWRVAHRRLCEHLANTSEFQPERLSDLLPLCQSVIHGCKAGLAVEMFSNIYYPRIDRGQGLLWRRFGAFDITLQTLSAFFREKWTQPRGLGIAPDWMRNEVALCLRASGRLHEAIAPLRTSMENAFDSNEWNEAAIRARNLSELELEVGDIADAVTTIDKAGKYADKSGVKSHCISILAANANALNQAGQGMEAFALFIATLELHGAESLLPDQISEFQFCDLYLSPVEREAWQVMLEHRSSMQSQEPTSGQDRCQHDGDEIWSIVFDRAAKSIRETAGKAQCSVLGVALDHLTAGRATLLHSILDGEKISVCRHHIQQAVDGLVRSQNYDDVPRGLLSRAWMDVIDGKTDTARADLDEAWDIASRGPMRLHMADIHLYRARLFFREKPYPWKFPQDDLAAAEKLINECGYHRRDVELADAKRAILGS